MKKIVSCLMMCIILMITTCSFYSVAATKANEDKVFITSCKEVAYNDVARDPDKYKDEHIQVTGTVIQVLEGWFGVTEYRIMEDTNDYDYSKIWYVTYSRPNGEARILEGDTVTVYGTCKGVQTYYAVLGNLVTIPSVKAKYIKLKK